MPTKTTAAVTTEQIATELLSVARTMNQVKRHDTFCKQAGVDLDRGGAALLYKLYSEGENARVTDLADRLGIDAPAVTRKVQQLERAGLLCRSADPDDARAHRLTLTTDGRRSIEQLLLARQHWLEETLVGWSQEDRAEFARLLNLFASTIAEVGGEHHGA
jgi:DNA-binding MarR family transcriptional regulator